MRWRQKITARKIHQGFTPSDSFTPEYGSKQNLAEIGLVMRRSERWLPHLGLSTKVRVRGIPFVKSGHIGGCITTFVKCSSAQWYTTLVYSVYRSLAKRVHLRTYGKRKWNADLLMRLSIYYVITFDDHHLERVLRTSGNPRKAVEKLAHQMDDQKRFLYGQTCLHVSWLKSRGSKIPRVKSITKCFIEEYRIFGLRSYSISQQIVDLLDWLSDPWIVGPFRYVTARRALEAN